jgi:hypothetical protein
MKNAKQQARRVLLQKASNKLIKVIVECAMNTLNGNHNLSKETNTSCLMRIELTIHLPEGSEKTKAKSIRSLFNDSLPNAN